MNTALTIVFLLLPAYPSFVDLWMADSPLDPVLVDTPLSTHQYMSDAELKKQVELLKKMPDPATRCRIVADIGRSYNKDVFTVLDEWLANEKDQAVRADIISILANLPVAEKKPANHPSIQINSKTAHAAEYEKSRNSSYLPEKMAAENFLRQKKALPHAPAVNEITKEQSRYFKMREQRNSAMNTTLIRLIDSAEHPLIRAEIIRLLAAAKKLPEDALPKLKKVIIRQYIRSGSNRKFDHDSIRAAAYMALVEHEAEPAVAEVLKEVDDALKSAENSKYPLFQEYLRQIRLYRNGAKEIAPSPLPQKGHDQTFKFTE